MDKPKSTEWPSEDRIESIGQNGPSGDHYEDEAFRECERRINDRNLSADLRAANRARQEQIEALSADLVKARNEKDALAAHLERWSEWLARDPEDDDGGWMDDGWEIHASSPETSLAHRIAHVAEQCDLPRLLRDYRAMVGLASITGPAKRERIEHVTSVEIAMFGAKQKYVISATRGRQAGGDA